MPSAWTRPKLQFRGAMCYAVPCYAMRSMGCCQGKDRMRWQSSVCRTGADIRPAITRMKPSDQEGSKCSLKSEKHRSMPREKGLLPCTAVKRLNLSHGRLAG